VFSQTITRGADQLLLNRALVSVACLDATHFKPARLPEPLVAALKIS
jgi:acyl-CoA thioesterase FadM